MGRAAAACASTAEHDFVRQALSPAAGSAASPFLQGSRPALPHHHVPMKVLNLLHVVLAQAFYRWAMREINPMHPDVPKIMLRQQQLSEKYRRIWA